MPLAVTPTAIHEFGAAQETLTKGLDERSTVQVTLFQPTMSDPTAVQFAADAHYTPFRTPDCFPLGAFEVGRRRRCRREPPVISW